MMEIPRILAQMVAAIPPHLVTLLAAIPLEAIQTTSWKLILSTTPLPLRRVAALLMIGWLVWKLKSNAAHASSIRAARRPNR